MGDVCRTVPVLASLRRAYPDAQIDWVVQDTFAPAVAAHPGLSNIIRFPRSRFAGWWRNASVFRDMFAWFKRVRGERYDLVIDCQGLGRSGLITGVTGARRRVGDRASREYAWLAYNARHRLDAKAKGPLHTVDRMLGLIEAEGIPVVRDMRLYNHADDLQWWTQQREALGIQRNRYAVLAPTSRWQSKRWPIERWAELVKPLIMRGFDHIVLIGGPNEQLQVQPILPEDALTDSPLVNLVDQTSIGQTMAVIAEAGLVIANDSAPLHMAVGFDRPCVGLFGPTDPHLVGPYNCPQSVLRAFQPRPGEIVDYKDPKLADRLMRVISSAAVVNQVDRVLALCDSQDDQTEQTDALANHCAGGGQ